jgi:hypothetical protein
VVHTAISPTEQADRLAISELIDAYAHCADRRDVRATGKRYCIAHHVFSRDGGRKIMLAYLRYLDTFVKQGATWLFAERNLYLEFSDTRTLGG